MNHFQTIGHCIDVIISAPDEDLKRLGYLETVQSLRDAISTPQWETIEGVFIFLADIIMRKEQQDNGNCKT